MGLLRKTSRLLNIPVPVVKITANNQAQPKGASLKCQGDFTMYSITAQDKLIESTTPIEPAMIPNVTYS